MLFTFRATSLTASWKIERLILLAALMVPPFGFSASDTQWKTFRSESYRYTVMYPASWYTIYSTETPKALDILNFPPSERVHGVVLKKSGAEITVGGAPDGVGSIDEWVRRDARNGTLQEDNQLDVRAMGPAGCTNVRRIVTRSEAGERTFFVYTLLYCKASGHLYRVALTNWEGDPNQLLLQQTALRVAMTLRAW